MAQKSDTIAVRSAEVILGPNPIIGFRARDVAREALRVARLTVAQPQTTIRVATSYGKELRRVFRGESELEPNVRDRRFEDPAWRDDARYRKWLQAYLGFQAMVADWITQQDLKPHSRARLRFMASQVTDALAPSNFPWQPEAVRRFRETGGHSALDGVKNFLRDLKENRGLPSQVDKAPFKIGQNLATTEGAVILQTELIELIQYRPLTSHVKQTPVLIVPPQINKFYVFDLAPEKSVVRGLLAAGFQTFIISWRNPTPAQADWGLAEYAAAIDMAVSTVCALTGHNRVNLAGACAGGLTLASYVAVRSAAGDTRIAGLTLLVNVLDQGAADETTLGLFATPAAIEAAKRYSARKGTLDGKDLATAFAWLRPNDLVWSYWVNNVLLGNKPPAFDVLYWNNDSTRLPARLHAEFLDMYKTNALAKPGTLRLLGVPVDLGKVRCDTYLIAGTTDHITPWKASYASTQLFGGNNTFVLSNSGHIQSILNPPGRTRSEFWTGGEAVADPDRWKKAAQRHEGSWWPHWHNWLGERSATNQVAPAELGSADYPQLGAAPGTYVLG